MVPDVALGTLNNQTQIPQLMQQNQAVGNQLAEQKLQQQSQQNVLATQVLSAASSTGNQGLYDSAKMHLSSGGIDTSMWPQDVGSGQTFAQSARLAQSPLGSLLNAGAKMDANNIAANTAAGQATPDPNAMQTNLMRGAMNSVTPGAGSLYNPPQQVNAQPRQAPPTLPPSAPGANIPVMQQAAAGQPQAPQQALQQPIDNNGSTATRFVPPPIDPTKTQAANQAAQEDARQAWQENPAVKGAQAQGTKTGELTAQDIESANKAQELTDRLKQNLLAMKAINNDVPSSGILPVDAKTWANQAMAANGLDTKAADASGQWDQINSQQTISEIQQFMASGGANTRINQTLDKMVQAASGIDKSLLPSTRAKMIDSALAEIGNKSISAGNIAAKEQGGTAQPYNAIPTGQAAGGIQEGSVIQNAGGLKMMLKNNQWMPIQ